MSAPVIALLTDFGTRDHSVGAMTGVMLGICPGATLVDISHDIEAASVASFAGGAFAQVAGCVAPLVRTYADVARGALRALIGRTGHLEVATSGGHASRMLGLERGAAVSVRPISS